jgi:pimeloyl-ACP methyl ester carboxylesterase
MRMHWLGIATMLTMFLTPAGFTQGQSSESAIDQSLAPYASTANSVRLPGGRTIHFTCAGRGSPTVILTAGGGGWGIHWNKVQPAIAAKTRVCAWDRAGFGLSAPSPLTQTVDNTTSDLEAALAHGGITGPYVLVGHSAGAYESLLLADRQPAKVVGMVLVDPSIPNQAARFRRATPAIFGLMGPSDQQPFVALLRKCAAAIRSGAVRRGAPDPDSCLLPPPLPSNYPEPLRLILSEQGSSASLTDIASAMDTLASSHASFDESGKMVVSPHRSYGAMPLIVLTAGEFHLSPEAPQAAKDEVATRQAEWHRAHDEYAALSARGVNRIVPGSAHVIQWDKPQVVIDSVTEVVDAARTLQHPR